MQYIADLHIHSKYSRATSTDMEIPVIAEYCKKKGVKLAGTGDFTHPLWLKHLKETLTETGNGLYKYKDTHFILTAEICNIFPYKEKVKKIHNLVLAPDFGTVEKINVALSKFTDLSIDGRPILNIPAKELAEIVLEADPTCIIIPAHVWTPHFSLFGSNSGFDDIEECFGALTPYIYALETGLSSNPGMNWMWSKLDSYKLVSNSDAHSPLKIGREANIMEGPLSYNSIIENLKSPQNGLKGTIEFFPEEGKYHWDGHRNCGVQLHPKDSMANNNLCPICGRRLTVGVLQRVYTLSDREEGFIPPTALPYYTVIPLIELIAKVRGKNPTSKVVINEYMDITQRIGAELELLIYYPEEDLKNKLDPLLFEAIIKVRNKDVKISPGYDGVYGKIELTPSRQKFNKQMELF